jgi:hypothetical protein
MGLSNDCFKAESENPAKTKTGPTKSLENGQPGKPSAKYRDGNELKAITFSEVFFPGE